MERSTPPKLLLHAEKVLPQPVHPHLIACCPTMDLVAVVNQEEQLNVYRFGGQRAFGLQRRNGDSKVMSLGWKFNGQYLAVGWSDGIVEVVSAETGNVLQHFRQPSLSGKVKAGSDTSEGVTCVGWGLNFIDVAAVKKKTAATRTNESTSSNPFDRFTSDDWEESRENASLDDFLERIPDADKIDIPLDLPEQLARIDISSSMVKLPALPLLPPAAYKNGDHPAAELFSSQISLDGALYSNSSQNINALEALLLAHDSGQIRLILYDALSIGSVTVPTDWKTPKVGFRKCASHPFSSTYMFLVDILVSNGQTKTALVPLSLRFLHSSGSQLHIIELKTAQLEILVQYVGECLLALHHHWKHAKELPSRFMEGINETLEEKHEPNLVQSLFHLAATGDCPATLKEWLVDILAERGHKRWDHAITHGYTKVLELTHENLLPALDRCVAILSHLRGLAIYHEHSPVFNVPAATFDAILNIIRCMRLLAHHLLLFCSEEAQQFTIFSKWLRHEIDVQASESPSNPAEDAEQDLNIDYSLLLSYIQGPLEVSKLDPFVRLEQDAPAITASASMYEEMKRDLDGFKAGEGTKNELITLGTYFDEWMRHNRTLVDQITSHQRASSSITSGIVLEEGDVLVSDMRMVQGADEDLISVWTAVVHKDTLSQVKIIHVTHKAEFESSKSVQRTLSGVLSLPRDVETCDLKLADDENIVLLAKDGDSFHLLSFRLSDISSEFGHGRSLDLCEAPSGYPLQTGESVRDISAEDIRGSIRHTFAAEDRFKPSRIEINGRKNRRFMVVLEKDSRQMRIFDLDFQEGDTGTDHSDGRAREEEDGDMMNA